MQANDSIQASDWDSPLGELGGGMAPSELYSLERLQPGSILGSYQLIHSVARGGMGQVWAARRTGRLGLPQYIAIKTALPGVSTGPDLAEQLFFDEARVAAAVDHPNVCRVYDLAEDSGVLYIAMEWIDGVSLATLMGARHKPRRLSPEMAAYIVAKACAGLHAAHELTDEDGVPLEVIHRDATAQNILVSVTGAVKVVDFGIVKSRDQAHQATMTGQLKGKVSYFAPEQLLGKGYDRRVDIFALGCVLYLLSTGSRPFHCGSPGATMMKIIKGEYAPPCDCVPDFPQELSSIITKALAIKKEERYSTAQEMQDALEAFLSNRPVQAGSKELAELVRQTVGDSVQKRRAEIRDSLKFFESQSGSSQQLALGSLPGPAEPAGVRQEQPSHTGEASLLTGQPYTVLSEGVLPRARRGRLLIPALALATIVVVAGAVWVGPLSASPASTAPERPTEAVVHAATPPVAAEAPEPAPAEPVNLVTIQVRTVPNGATLRFDDGPALPAPYTLQLPADGALHVLHASAPGFAPLEQPLRLDHSQTITLRLKRLKRARQSPAPRASAIPASEPQAPPPMDEEMPSLPPAPKKAPSKPAHTIDFSDPFAE